MLREFSFSLGEGHTVTFHSDFTQHSSLLLKSVACAIYLILEAMSLPFLEFKIYFWRVAARCSSADE